VKLDFWLLDINAEVKAGVPQLWLWGIDSGGNRVLVIDRRFIAYFYVVVSPGYDASKLAREILDMHSESIVKIEAGSRKLFGASVEVLKVYCDDPQRVAKLLRSFEGVKDCLEDDIRMSMRYLIDNNVVPCRWHNVEVREEANMYRVRVDKVYLAETVPILLEQSEVNRPDLRILSFSIICYSQEGSPQADKNPIIIISTVNSQGEQCQFLANDKDDTCILQQFICYIHKYNPDIIAGYGTNAKWMAYIRERTQNIHLRLKIDRANSEPHPSVYGHYSLTGIVHLDLADFTDLFADVKVKTLENIADHLGIMRNSEHPVIWDVDFANYWDNSQEKPKLLQFSMDTAVRIKGILDALLDFSIQLSSLVSLPLDHVMTAAVGFRVDWFLIKHAQPVGELVPKRTEEPYKTYVGGLVLEPHPGIHKNIAVLDFKSMHPNLMISYNLSPDTYIPPDQDIRADNVFEAPEVGYRFRKQPPGFYKEALTYLIAVRSKIRSQMKKLSPQNSEYKLLDVRQKAVKVITNALYGYAGWVGARWYSKPVAEAASAWGRYIIKKAAHLAEELGLKVIYGDTDSLFTTYDKQKTSKLIEKITKDLKLEIALEKLYVRVLFTEAKKRYAGLLQDGTVESVGLEVIRGDWAQVAKQTQEHVLEIILKEEAPEKAKRYIYDYVQELKQGLLPFRDFIIWKTLTRPINAYSINAAHVEAAQILQQKGWKISVGDKVGYVITKGKGPLYKRAQPYMFTSQDILDFDYYVNKQIVPAAARVLGFFNISEKDLIIFLKREVLNREEKSLEKYLGA